MAGIAPGMMMGATLMLTWWWQASRLNLPRQQKATMQEIWHSFVSGIWALFLPVIIIGGFRSGLFTPTEAGAVAAFYALFVLRHTLACAHWRSENDLSGDVSGGLGTSFRLADHHC